MLDRIQGRNKGFQTPRASGRIRQIRACLPDPGGRRDCDCQSIRRFDNDPIQRLKEYMPRPSWKFARLFTASLLPFLLLAACFYVFKIDLDTLLRTWGSLSLSYLLPAFVLNFSMLLLRAHRWRLILNSAPSAGQKIGFQNAFAVLTIGYLANQLLPAPSGEVARAVVLSRREGLRKVHVLSTIVVERVIDVLALAPVILFVFLVIPLPVWLERLAVLAGLVLVVMAVAGVIVHSQREHLLQAGEALIRRVSGSVQGRLLAFRDSFGEGLHILRDLRRLTAVYGHSVAAWALQLAAIEMVSRALHQPLSLGLGVLLILLANTGTLLPMGAGNLGTFQVLAITLLAIFRIRPEVALSISVVFQAVQFLPVAVLGLYALWSRGLSIETVKSETRT
jgi:uncharacterized protein (TIRG00374 family)